MTAYSGPTWRRLKSCLEYKFRDIEVPAVNLEDRVKQIGLLVGLRDGKEEVLVDEVLQLQLGKEAAAGVTDADLLEQVHSLAHAAPLERFL